MYIEAAISFRLFSYMCVANFISNWPTYHRREYTKYVYRMQTKTVNERKYALRRTETENHLVLLPIASLWYNLTFSQYEYHIFIYTDSISRERMYCGDNMEIYTYV